MSPRNAPKHWRLSTRCVFSLSDYWLIRRSGAAPDECDEINDVCQHPQARLFEAFGITADTAARLFPWLVGLSLQQGLHIGGLERKPPTDLTGRVVEGSRDRRSRKGVGRF